MMDPEAVKNELCDSKKYLEDLISGKVLSVAYPFGLYDANLVELAVQCGYKYGCSGMWNRAAELSAMCLQRIPVYRTDSLKAFYRKLSNGFSNAIEMSKLRVISWPARLTPVYQKISIATKNFLQKKIRLVSFEESSGE
jgi:peptidoglycan/xylan/chitin deacetylase (PgdA/CDA1 family)